MGEGLLQIIIGAVLILTALKIAKNIAKTLFIAVIAVAGFLLVKGIVDWAMLETLGYSVLEWLKIKLADNSAVSTAMIFNSFIFNY